MDRRIILKRTTSLLALSAMAVFLKKFLGLSGGFYYEVLHSGFDSTQYADRQLSWVDRNRFVDLNKEFEGNGRLISFKVKADPTGRRYQWLFDSEKSYREYEMRLAKDGIFLSAEFKKLNIDSQKMRLPIA